MTELEIDMNMRIGEWSILQESGRQLTPCYGPGYTGLSNLGNRWGVRERGERRGKREIGWWERGERKGGDWVVGERGEKRGREGGDWVVGERGEERGREGGDRVVGGRGEKRVVEGSIGGTADGSISLFSQLLSQFCDAGDVLHARV